MRITINRLLLLILGIAYVFIAVAKHTFYTTSLVDWKTVAILSSLIFVNTGLMYSGGINYISQRIMRITRGTRQLMVISVLLTSFVAMFLTNDVSLLILIPITLAIGKFSGKNLDNVIIFQAIAANVGSMLMPFGNPQNIILFRLFLPSFVEFVRGMLPIFLFSMAILILFSIIPRNEEIVPAERRQRPNIFFFVFNLALIIVALTGILLNATIYLFIILIGVSFATLFFLKPEAVLRVDYELILVFILIFLVMNSVRTLIPIPLGGSGVQVYFSSIVLSQFISNVPTTVLFGKVSSLMALSYGVNIGGNGTIIASLANIIALRSLSGKNFLRFNKYSFLFLGITAMVGFFMLFG